jgi:hypothetical protein
MCVGETRRVHRFEVSEGQSSFEDGAHTRGTVRVSWKCDSKLRVQYYPSRRIRRTLF